MRQLLKNNKGFTLIELMMVIAIIGILAAVLIPKMGVTKDNARIAGVESNIRQVETQVQGMIHRYRHDAGGLEDNLTAVLGDAGSEPLENPFVGNTALTISDEAAPAGGSGDPGEPGLVYVQITDNDSTTGIDDDADIVEVTITAYDNSSDPEVLTSTTIAL